MKLLNYLCILILASITVDASAQSDKTVKKDLRGDISSISYDSAKILLRPLEFKTNMKSVKDVRSANKEPLLILDGVEYSGTMDDINVDEIETLSVLKDKKVKEKYGIKAANGVILITTKRDK